MELLIVSDLKMLSIYVKSSECGLFVVSLRDCVYIVFFNKKDINLIFFPVFVVAPSLKRGATYRLNLASGSVADPVFPRRGCTNP